MEDVYSEDDYLYLSGIQHFAFCKRQWALIHIEQQWAENSKTTEGNLFHERAHKPLLKEEYTDRVVTRSVYLKSNILGLCGMADIVEFHATEQTDNGRKIKGREGFWYPVPVEYKKGKPKVDDIDAVQLCAQAICLEEMLNLSVKSGYLFYGETKRRTIVKFNRELRARVQQLSKQMHEMFAREETPLPEYSKKCKSCSLFDICNPKMTNKFKDVNRYISKMLDKDTPAEENLNEKTS